MKKSPILILTLSALLASCGVSDAAASSNSSKEPASSSDAVSSSDISSSSSDSSSSSSSSSAEPVTIKQVGEACSIAVANANKVASGTVTKSRKYSWSDDIDTCTDTYEYGTDAYGTIFHSTTDINDYGSEAWVVHDDNGALISVSKNSSGAYSQPYNVYEDAGYYFSSYMGSSTSYGTENLLTELVGYATANKNKDLVVDGKNGTFSLSYIYFTDLDAWTINKVFATFTVDGDGVLTDLTASFSTYANNSFVVDDENETISLNADAVPTMEAAYSVTQVKGTQSYTAPFALSDFYFTAFNFTDSEGNTYDDGDTFTFTSGESPVLNPANMAPATGSFSFDELKVSIVDGDSDELSAYSYSGNLNLSSSTPGNYKVKIQSKNLTKVLNIVVEEALPTAFGYVGYYVESPEGFEDGSIKNDAFDAYIDTTYYFSTSIDPYAANQSISASVVGTTDTDSYALEKKSVYVNSWDDEATELWAFTPKKAGDYSVELVADANTSLTKTITIHAITAPTLKDFFSSKFGYRESGEVKYIFDFTPSEDGMSGTLTLEDKVNSKSEVASYTLTKGDSSYKFTFTRVSGDTLIDDEDEPIKLELGFNWTLYIVDSWDDYNKLSVTDSNFYIAQKWKGTDGNYDLTVNITSGGNATFDFEDTVNYEDYFYFQANWDVTDNADGTHTVTLTENSEWGSLPDNCPFDLPYTMTVSADYSSMSATVTYKDVTHNFSLSYSASGRWD